MARVERIAGVLSTAREVFLMATMLIDGQTVKAQAGKTLEVRNPANGEVVDTIPRGSAADVDAAVEAAAKALPAWASLSGAKRAALMHQAAEKVRAAVPEIAKLLTPQQGKPLPHAVIEATRVAENLEFFAGFADKLRGNYVPLEDQNKFGLTLRRPVGVVAAITPWNFPLTLMANKVCPALAAGCTVILKPASTTPLATQRTIEIMNSVGIPAGVLNTVHGPGADIGDALVSHPKVNKIAFTGQTETGKRIMKLAADNVTRVTLELGGSDPMIVCDDADIRRATAATAIGRFFNAGQSCLAVKRVYLFEQIAEEFMAKIADQARKAAELLEAGYTWINDIQVAYDQLPFGGTKQSGFGKEHGIEGLDGYLEKKSVVLAY